ncbi:AEC family transporter, partial [candidate division FCPU426 bacterium]|nr:AEC family transporter [candidate division FCPU426 bacterium]
ALFFGALGLGLALHPWRRAASFIMRCIVLLFDTPLFFYAFWTVDLNKVLFYAPVPLLAVLLVLLTLWLSPGIARRVLANPSAQGVFILSAAFSNVGTTGGSYICYLLFGLPGLALGYLFLLPYPILIFTLGFSTAKHYASSSRLSWRGHLANITGNIFSLLPLSAIALGLVLNSSGFIPPRGLALAADIWIKAGLGLMCLAIGMTLTLQNLFRPWRALLWLGVIKFLFLPAAALVFLLLVYGSLTPLPAKVILIQAAMPPAMYAVITANLFGLDRELVNSLWFSTTVMLIPLAGIFFLLWA